MQRAIHTELVVISLVFALIVSIGAKAVAQEASAKTPTSTDRQSVVYMCSMHPEVRSDKPGNCIKCGIPLLATTNPPKVLEYSLKLETTPTVVKPGEKLHLRFLIFHPETGEQVKHFNVTYDKLFHLFIVRQDLEYYEHIHPTLQADGSFSIDTVLPQAGFYKLFGEFVPEGGTPQVIQRSLTTADLHRSDHHFLQTNLVPDKSLLKSVEGIRFELKLEPEKPIAGQPTVLKYYLLDDKTGLPVTNVQPYLGAWGHTATISEDLEDFLHSHPTKLIPSGFDRTKLVSRPRISFHTFFPKPGHYRIWSQFQRENKVITVSFTIDVSRLDRIAKWDGSVWSLLVRSPINGLDGPVHAIAVKDKDVYVGGNFSTVDGVSASRIARWDGHKWSSLEGGVNGNVWSLAVNGSDVYVGGDFTLAGGVSANRIAKWDGRKWSALGSGIKGCKDAFCSTAVYALAISGNDVYAGGRFDTAGAVATNGIAKWDGHVWSALGDGTRTGIYDGVVRALAVSGKDLYVGGHFITAGEITAYNIAKWNGHSWSALGSGIRGNMEEVLAIALSESHVYVGGLFTMAGGIGASNIAVWKVGKWSSPPLSTNQGVWKIAADGSNVYLGGGEFLLLNGVVVKGIVKWDGGQWSALGGGFSKGAHTGPVMAIAMSGSEIYIGGNSFIVPGAQVVQSAHQTGH